ncbi:hypothetical protein [Nitrosopumilus sp.]|uniref:hypothetical protein n=1 Tax=Nitrosopumilus sp. TaxID=2024843 RepID=UPI00292FF75E|nr:hypothetical protein [Nitrosopumilus sp.]
MAKFKKKKSKPTLGTDRLKKDSVREEPAGIPNTEKPEPVPDTPSVDPSINTDEKNEKDKKLNKLFWLRVGLAVLAGTAATFIFEDIEGEDRRWASIGFMIVIFMGTIIVAKGMKMQLPSSDRKKLVTQGIGSYVFIYLFVWILSYTLVHTGSMSSGIPSPIS